MSTRASTAMTGKEAQRLLRAWGWKHHGDGRNHAKWVKDGVTVTLRRGSGADITYEPLRAAANVEGLSFAAWCEGPPNGKDRSCPDVPQEDLDWFLDHPVKTLTHPDDVTRYRRIREALAQQGTLEDWIKVRIARNGGTDPNAAPLTTHEIDVPVRRKVDGGPRPAVPEREPVPPAWTPPSPISRRPDTFTLTDLLAMRNLGLTPQGFPSGQLLATLAERGPFTDPTGRATAPLMAALPNPPKHARAVTMLVAAWESVGVVERDVRGKRTTRIAMAVPVHITDAERAWLRDAGGTDTTTPPERPQTDTGPVLVDDPPDVIDGWIRRYRRTYVCEHSVVFPDETFQTAECPRCPRPHTVHHVEPPLPDAHRPHAQAIEALNLALRDLEAEATAIRTAIRILEDTP